MQLYSKLMILVLLTGVCMLSCTKGTINDKQFYYGTIDISIASLPAAPEVDVYVDDAMIKTLNPVLDAGGSYSGEVSEKKNVKVYRKGTKDLLADTLVALNKDQKVSLKLAISEPLGLSGFLKSSTTVEPDLCRFQLYNGLTTGLQPDGVEVDAVVFYEGEAGQMIEATTLENFERGKVHPMVVTLPARNYYSFKFRNRATGEFLMDAFGADYASWNVVGGKYYILSAIGYPLLPGWDMLYVDFAEL